MLQHVVHHVSCQTLNGPPVTDTALNTIPLFSEGVKCLVSVYQLMTSGQHLRLGPLLFVKMGLRDFSSGGSYSKWRDQWDSVENYSKNGSQAAGRRRLAEDWSFSGKNGLDGKWISERREWWSAALILSERFKQDRRGKVTQSTEWLFIFPSLQVFRTAGRRPTLQTEWNTTSSKRVARFQIKSWLWWQRAEVKILNY